MVEQSVEERGDGCGVAEQLAPVVDWAIRRQQCRCPLVPAHDQLEQILGGSGRQLAHAEVVDHEEWHGSELSHDLLATALEGRVREFLEEHMRLAVADAMSLLDRAEADRLGEVTLAGARRSEEEHVLASLDEARSGELVDELAVHLLVEVEVEVVERPADVTKLASLSRLLSKRS